MKTDLNKVIKNQAELHFVYDSLFIYVRAQKELGVKFEKPFIDFLKRVYESYHSYASPLFQMDRYSKIMDLEVIGTLQEELENEQ